MTRVTTRRSIGFAPLLALLISAGAVLSGCAALREDMLHAESAFDAAQYDESLVWLSDLEDDVPDMDVEMRARFYYLRGMTAYRLGKRADALHYLALAREVSGPRSEGLRPEWATSMTRTITELAPNGAGGEESRTGEPTSGGEQPAPPASR
jgi:hypothetical protein